VPNYDNLNSGWMSEAFSALGYNSTSIWSANDGADLLDKIQADLDGGKAVTLATWDLPDGSPLVGLHAYTVDHIVTDGDGQRHLVLRNPWAIDGYTCTDGANDGYVTITADQAYNSFSGIISARV
jgi:hypothetical protein